MVSGARDANSPYFCIGDRSKRSSYATEYFDYILTQDWEQLSCQKNSVGGPSDARRLYASFQVLKSLAPSWVEEKHDHGPFKLVFDDVSLTSLIVRSKDDLTIVGLVDLEWVYVAPAQMAASAPWWLLQDRLNNWDTFYDKDEALALAPRYLRHLQVFQRVLAEEEEKLPGNPREFSNLVEWSRTSGAMWFHMLLAWGFHHPDSLPAVLPADPTRRKG